MQINAQWLGFIRAILYVVAFGVLSFLGDASHLNGLLNPQLTTTVTLLATALLGMLDGHIEAKTGRAAFGAVSRK